MPRPHLLEEGLEAPLVQAQQTEVLQAQAEAAWPLVQVLHEAQAEAAGQDLQAPLVQVLQSQALESGAAEGRKQV